MSSSTKRAAKRKLQNMKANIGYPKESFDKKIVDETYQGTVGQKIKKSPD